MTTLAPDLLVDLPTAAALRRLFVALGYDEQQQVSYTPQTLAWPDQVATELRGRAFELLATADDGFFQVLLLPPAADGTTLSQALLLRLWQTLEQRGHEGLLLLPAADGATLELVLLLDPRALDARQGLPELLRWRLAPRALLAHHQAALAMLAVQQAGPGEVAELVLRAFRRAQQERFLRSVNFFSTYYLEQRLANDPTYDLANSWADLLPQMAALRPQLAPDDPAATLAALGWTLVAQAAAPAQLHYQGRALALVALLPPDHPLDRALSTSNDPQLALLAALEQQRQQQDGVRWALLTNGRSWRLYSHVATSISGAFYEVALDDLLAYGSDEDLRYFVGFFGAAALGGQFVIHAFASAQTLAREVGDTLKQVVFAEVVPLLANAIAADLRRKGEYDGSAAQLQLILRATLILLYRLLFLLYAESMRLLPTMHPAYYPHSLTFLLSDLALQPFTASHLRKPQTPTAYWAWQHLQALFAAISEGKPAWGVPKYNGGLFSDGAPPPDAAPSEHRAPHRLLARVQLGAAELGAALDRLGRDPQARAADFDGARRLIDYAGLDVRRLGSIYEGLLEFQLGVASDGSLALQQTRTERKASGSYYTPDYIVAYIVEQTVGPLLAERAKRFAELMERLPAARRALNRALANEGNERISITTAKANSDAARAAVAKLEHAAIECLLDLKILDPAMGSGHFLVAAVNFVTDRLLVILNRYQNDNPLLARLAAIRTQIRASLQAQGVDALISDEQLNNLNLLRRLVMKRCVFGVDLNDMAVELARLSLWLNSFTVGAPLNFLDHHLKWGNALIGARVQAVQQAMEGKNIGIGTQLDMFTSGSAFAAMLNLAGYIEQLVEIADANAQQVEQSEALYRSYEEHVVPVKRLLDLWVAQSFGNKVASELIQLHSGNSSDVQHLIDALMGHRQLAPREQAAVAETRSLFQRHRFLHWDLDFPEVFLDLANKAWKPAEQAGFDAVVGNPPYVSAMDLEKLLSEYEKPFWKRVFVSAQGAYDLYILFMEQALELLRYKGITGIITPNKYLAAPYAIAFRKYVLQTYKLLMLGDFSQIPIFEDASVYPVVSVISKEGQSEFYNIIVERFFTYGNTTATQSSGLLWGLPEHIWSILLSDGYNVIQKIINISIDLEKIAQVNASTTAAEADSFGPYLAEGQIVTEDSTWRVLNTGLIDRYESTWGYQVLTNQRHTYKFPVLPKASSVISRNRDQQYSSSKIIFAKMALNIEAFPDIEGDFASMNTNFAISLANQYNLLFLTSICNSCFLSWIYIQLFGSLKMGGDYFQFQAPQLRILPIRRISFTTPTAERTALVAEGQRRYEAGLAEAVSATTWRAWRAHWQELWAWAEARLPQVADGSPDGANEQSDVVHDLLAHLAERMIALHKAKQAAAAHFTDWLEQETGSAPSDWTLKTVVQSFWAQPWLEVERALQKNRGRFGQTQGLRGKQADAALQPLLRAAQREWMAACATLAPTLAAITATDRLIDLLVYRLYGLTDEEIDLVEG